MVERDYHARPDELVEQAIRDPMKMYGVPANVLKDERLKDTEKRIILESWALDQERLLESEAENMTKAPKAHNSPEEILRDIRKAERKLH
ncbi:MAG TPA: hypothetical protein VIN59_01500 [Alphaproteobacteria bacterium]